jgi:dihydroorotate dehydrogenase (NAD+) catalytic subunit
MVWEAVRSAKVPVIGIGGIMTGGDALEFILAGASAVEVGTANFVDPASTIKVLEGIEEYMARHGVKDIKELIGALES